MNMHKQTSFDEISDSGDQPSQRKIKEEKLADYSEHIKKNNREKPVGVVINKINVHIL